MANQRVAVIDLGTNTFQLRIAEWTGDQEYEILYKDMKAVLLGEGKGLEDEMISEDSYKRGIQALEEYQEKMEDYKVEAVYATGTQAIRAAHNGEEFLSEIQQKFDIDVQLISGDEEAEFIYYGVQQAVTLEDKPVLVMDLGGGSVEFVIARQEEILWKKSLPIGAAYLKAAFHRHEPMTLTEEQNLQEFLGKQLSAVLHKANEYKVTTLIGSSGSFHTIYNLLKKDFVIEKEENQNEFSLRAEDIDQLYEQLREANLARRESMAGMEEFRASMMVVATAAVKYIVDQLSIRKVIVSRYSLKEGILWCTRHHSEKLIENRRAAKTS